MIRACAAAALACVAASGKSGEGFSTLQSVRRHVESSTSQLAVAQKMQQTLGDALKSVIGASDPEAIARVNNDLIPLIEAQMLNMKNAIIAENDEDKNSIVTANNAVAQCNTDRNHSFEMDGGVDYKQYDTHLLRGTHSTCRGAEVVAADKTTTDCGHAQTLADAAVAATPECTAEDTIPSDMNAVNQCLTDVGAWLTTHQSALDAAIVVCNASRLAWENKAIECDGDQGNFEAQFCLFAQDLNSTCDTHADCYTLKKQARDDIEVSVRAKETSQKELWAAVCNIHCFIDLFQSANTSNLALDDHNACLDGSYVCPNGDDSGLTVTYTAPVAEDDCDTARQWWNVSEYSALNQSYINPTTACVTTWSL